MAKATSPLSEYARRVKVEPTIVTLRGRPVAAVVSLEGVDEESLAVSTDPRFIRIIQRSRKRQEEEGGVPAAEVRRLFDLPPAKRRRAR
jgi:hypothetical protein